MDADAGGYWIRFAKSAAVLALGAAAHVWLLPSTRSAPVTDELVNVGKPSSIVSHPSGRHTDSVIAMLESTPDHLAGAVPRSPLTPEPSPAGTSGRVIVAVENVTARSIFDRPQMHGPPERLASDAIAGTTGNARAQEAVATGGSSAAATTSRTLGTVGTSGTIGIWEAVKIPPANDLPQTAELQLASDGLLPSRRSAHETIALAKPAPAEDAPHIAVNARQLLDDEQMVRRVLQQYRTAYEQLDAAAAKSVWPTVDERALTHAFQQLASQRLTFRSCGVSITGEGANARCRGEAEYLPKIGAKRAYTTSGEWVFDLAREQTSWRIINATVQ